MNAIKAGLSFFTTIKAGGEFETLTENLYIMPVIGAIAGFIIALLSYPLFLLNISFIAIIIYIGIEGINHLDGLSDFADSFFAPENRKIKALKDLNLGTGGIFAVTTYLIILSNTFSKMDYNEFFFSVVLGQILAKQGMLHLILTENPLWEGLLSEFSRNSKNRDWFSYGFTVAVFLIFAFFNMEKALASLVGYISALAVFKSYVKSKYGGINGDMAGTLNCMVFALVVVVWSL